MKKTTQEALIKKHKSFFKLLNNKDFPINYGIECDEGWKDIISDTIDDVRELCKREKAKVSVQIMQIKEKMGELRIYFSIIPDTHEIKDEISKIEIEAARKSRTVCEICSKPGKERRYSRIKTLCWRCHWKEKLKRWKRKLLSILGH